jgi:hypothetical protein
MQEEQGSWEWSGISSTEGGKSVVAVRVWRMDCRDHRSQIRSQLVQSLFKLCSRLLRSKRIGEECPSEPEVHHRRNIVDFVPIRFPTSMYTYSTYITFLGLAVTSSPLDVIAAPGAYKPSLPWGKSALLLFPSLSPFLLCILDYALACLSCHLPLLVISDRVAVPPRDCSSTPA